jgi:hypothetical protein
MGRYTAWSRGRLPAGPVSSSSGHVRVRARTFVGPEANAIQVMKRFKGLGGMWASPGRPDRVSGPFVGSGSPAMPSSSDRLASDKVSSTGPYSGGGTWR